MGNAADVQAGSSSKGVAPGSLAAASYYDCCGSRSTTPSLSASFRAVGQNALISAPILSTTSTGSVIFLVPDNLPPGDAQFILEVNGVPLWGTVPVVPANFALFRKGTPGPLLAQNVAADGSSSLNGLANPAQPGQYVTLWGTGGGSVSGASPSQVAEVTLGGVPQRVVFAGPAPGQPGLIQINFQVSGEAPDGCYTPLVVNYGSETVSSFLSKTSDGNPCQHPLGLPIAAMKTLDAGGGVEGVTTTLTTAINAASGEHAFRSESGVISNSYFTAPALSAYFNAENIGTGTCGIGLAPIPISVIPDAGAGSVTLSNGSASFSIVKSGYSGNVPQSGDSPLASLAAAVISAGNWTWNASGVSILTKASFGFSLPPPIQLSMGSPVSMARNQDQTISWNASGYDSNAVVQIGLVQQTKAPDGSQPSIKCRVAAQNGSVTIPASLLSAFSGGAFGYLSATVTESGAGIPHANFSASGVGGGPVLALISWTSSDTRPVDFQ